MAAIITSQHGGSLSTAQVEAGLRASADDQDRPGNDEACGGDFCSYARLYSGARR